VAGGEAYGPSNIRVTFPPQIMSATWNDAGQCVRLSSAQVMDEFIGNTGGLKGTTVRRLVAVSMLMIFAG
jgi:hypothetical protein